MLDSVLREWTDVSNSFAIFASVTWNCYEILWLYIDKSRLQGIPQNVYLFIMGIQYIHIEYG